MESPVHHHHHHHDDDDEVVASVNLSVCALAEMSDAWALGTTITIIIITSNTAAASEAPE